MTVVNRVRAAAVGGGDARTEIAAALDRFAGVRDVRFVPLDVAAYDAALASGRTLIEVAKNSPARRALHEIAVSLVGAEQPRRRRRLRMHAR
jgi:Flp pilus assembly CpaE family ATPase